MEDRDNMPLVEEHNASFDEEPVVDTTGLSEEELQDTILADSNMSGFQRFIAKMDDKKWKLTQRILGIVLGLGAGFALFGHGLINGGASEQMGTYSLVLAVVIALLIPNIIEKKSGRKIQLARVTMAITLIVVLVFYFFYAGFNNGFQFFNK